MSSHRLFEDARRRRIYEYVEENGAVRPETVRENVQVRPETASKPARSGPELDPTMPMPTDEFTRHVDRLKADGHLEERDDKLRVGLTRDVDVTTVAVGDREATIRLARQEDIAGIIDVIKSVATGETHVVARRLADELSRNGVLVRHNESQNRVFFVATVDGDTVGWLGVEGTRYPAMSHTAELTLGVLEGYRNSGLGGELMACGLEWASDHGYRKLYQHLPATNERAVSFLANHGWTVEATREGHYDIDGELTDEVLLARWLHGAGD